jgi:hypothetical protein
MYPKWGWHASGEIRKKNIECRKSNDEEMTNAEELFDI